MIPTNEQIREEAINLIPLADFNVKGRKAEGLMRIVEQFNRLQFKYFPLFCEETRRVNLIMLKELRNNGYRTPTKYIAGKTYEGTYGWSRDKHFKFNWTIPNQLKMFMEHIHKGFWGDENSHVRDKFMKGILKGEEPYKLLDEVYKHYGSNVIRTVEKEDIEAVSV